MLDSVLSIFLRCFCLFFTKVINQERMPKREKILQGSWRVEAKAETACCSKRILRCSEINSRCSSYTLEKNGKNPCFLAATHKHGADCAESWNPNLKRKKPLLRRGQLGLILRDKQQKYSFSWGFSPRLKENRPRFQASLRISAVWS